MRRDDTQQSGLTVDAARRELDEIMGGEGSFEEKVEAALDLGQRFLGADNGHFTRIDQATDHWQALVSTGQPDGDYPPGLELDLGTTYCRRTLAAGEPIALHDAPAQGWADDPAYEAHGLRCYHGSPVELDGEPFGTVCFIAEDPHNSGFSDAETLFAALVSDAIERELERAHHRAERSRQSTLLGVLNRVLRHNLRNDLSVIRGRVQLLGDSPADDPHARIAVRKIDELVELSETAQELERIVRRDGTRRRTDVQSLVTDVAEATRRRYPAATIEVASGSPIRASVKPSFERAVSELVENAAKHGGETPTVSITVEEAPNAVEIRVTDDGPGLSAPEREVLRTGTETSLSHGTGLGLWLVYWIVTSHDGSVDAAVTDEGTTMTVSIPRMPEARRPPSV